MDLILLRHGIAADAGGKIKNDAQRPLTREGIAAMEEAAAGFQKLSLRFDAILTSPLVRARQTAEIVAAALHGASTVTICEALGIPASPADIVKTLRALETTAAVLLVGHQPDMGKLAGFFCGVPELSLPFKKGAACRIEVDRLHPSPQGELKWFLSPRQLRLIGRS